MKTLGQRVSLALAGLIVGAMEIGRHIKEGPVPKTKAAPGKIYEFTMKTIDGKDKPLADYKGQVLMIVNTASLCGLTPQYDGLEELHRKYKDRGLRVLAFPANEFGAQEPGSDEEIQQFCRTKYSVSFDLFSKIAVKGPGIHPLYQFLTSESGYNGAIGWNFAKFLVGKDGAVAARFDPPIDPMSSKVTGQVERLLAA